MCKTWKIKLTHQNMRSSGCVMTVTSVEAQTLRELTVF